MRSEDEKPDMFGIYCFNIGDDIRLSGGLDIIHDMDEEIDQSLFRSHK